MFSNRRDALPFDNKDRRIIVIEKPNDRRTPEDYAQLYGRIGDPAFIASVRRYLDDMVLTDFNAGEHAPLNDAKRSSLEAMMSETERAVVEFHHTRLTDLTTRSASD